MSHELLHFSAIQWRGHHRLSKFSNLSFQFYIGTPPNNTMVSNGTKVVVLPFNTSMGLVLQDTSILGIESHQENGDYKLKEFI